MASQRQESDSPKLPAQLPSENFSVSLSRPQPRSQAQVVTHVLGTQLAAGLQLQWSCISQDASPRLDPQCDIFPAKVPNPFQGPQSLPWLVSSPGLPSTISLMSSFFSLKYQALHFPHHTVSIGHGTSPGMLAKTRQSCADTGATGSKNH